MATNMPATVDAPVDPTAGQYQNSPSHSGQHDNANDAILAMERITVGPTNYNVKGYGATGNGSTDDTAAVNSCLTAANNAGKVNFPPGKYVLSSLLEVGGGSPGALVFQGDAAWNSELFLANGANAYMLSCGGTYTRGLTFRDLYLNGNGNNQSSGGIFYGYGDVWCIFDHCWFDNPYTSGTLNTSNGAAVSFYQNGSGGYGQHNTITHCLFWNSNGVTYANQIGVLAYQSDELFIQDNIFQGVGQTTQSYPSAIFDQSGLNKISGNTFVSGTGIYVGGSGSRTRVIGNHLDGSQSGSGQIYAGSTGTLIEGNWCYAIPVGADGIFVDNCDHVSVIGNHGQTASGVVSNSFINLNGSPTYCNIGLNEALTVGGGSYTHTNGIALGTSMTGTQIFKNIPFNPYTPSTPGFPTTTSTYTNSTGVDVMAYINNGTGAMTTTVNGATGPAIGASATRDILIPAGGTFKPTFGSGTPTWVFVGV